MPTPGSGKFIRELSASVDTGARRGETQGDLTVNGDLDITGDLTKNGSPIGGGGGDLGSIDLPPDGDGSTFLNDQGEFTEPEGGGGEAYLIYVALLTQTGTNAPAATVLANTLGGTVVWTRLSAGVYQGTLTGAFVNNKTGVFITSNDSTGIFAAGRLTANVVQVGTGDNTGAAQDGWLAQTMIEIRVYP